MASPLTQRALQRLSDSGFARAKKLADLAIKTNTDSSGKATARGYEQAVALLEPYILSGKETESIDAQRLVASYSNSLTKLSKNQRDQNETVSAFKLQELDAYFTSFDGDVGGFRDPSSLVDTTSESLDNIVLGVLNAIDEKDANGESTDALYSYLNDITKRSDSLRNLRNRFASGELSQGQSLDGFGYYVDTDPLDGSIRAAALLPVGLTPDGLAGGYRRIDATTNVGGALLPVYVPATQNAYGEYSARVGDAVWTGTGSGALKTDKATNDKGLFEEGNFNISDRNKFPVRTAGVKTGSFAKGFIGRDDQGNPLEAVFYKGMDGKLYTVDQETLSRFEQDPVLSQKLSGYVTQFSPSEIRELARDAAPLPVDRIERESRFSKTQTEYEKAQAEAERYENMGFFSQLKEGFSVIGERARKAREENQGTQPQPSFFQRTNEPNKPDEPKVGESTPDIIETGKTLFRKAAGFFTQNLTQQ